MNQATTLVAWSCKRTEKLLAMFRSIHANCQDKHLISHIVISDDNSDVIALAYVLAELRVLFPNQVVVLRHRANQPGMSYTWRAAWREVETPYALNMEDDWVFTEPGNYIGFGQALMEAERDIAQVVFSYQAPGSNYAPYLAEELWRSVDAGQYLLWPDNHPRWPGYTNNPSLIHLNRLQDRMVYPWPYHHHCAEYHFGERFKDAGLKVAFLPRSVTAHTGDQRAFDLNKTLA